MRKGSVGRKRCRKSEGHTSPSSHWSKGTRMWALWPNALRGAQGFQAGRTRCCNGVLGSRKRLCTKSTIRHQVNKHPINDQHQADWPLGFNYGTICEKAPASSTTHSLQASGHRRQPTCLVDASDLLNGARSVVRWPCPNQPGQDHLPQCPISPFSMMRGTPIAAGGSRVSDMLLVFRPRDFPLQRPMR